MKFAICQEIFEGWDWQRQCRFIAEVGYTGIEVAPFTLAPRITDVSAETRQTMRQQAADCGLTIAGLHWLLAKTEGLHLTSSDPAVKKATTAYLIDLGNACADFGGEVMVFGSPPQRSLQEGTTREQAYANAADVFREALPAFVDRGVRLCMEPLTKQETDFVNTCAEAMELIEMVDHPGICLHQDVKAMRTAETEPIPALIERYIPQLGHFHANDTNLLGPGMGDTDYVPIFEALLRVGYEGWVSVEPFDYTPGCEKLARDSLAYMQDVVARVSR